MAMVLCIIVHQTNGQSNTFGASSLREVRGYTQCNASVCSIGGRDPRMPAFGRDRRHSRGAWSFIYQTTMRTR